MIKARMAVALSVVLGLSCDTRTENQIYSSKTAIVAAKPDLRKKEIEVKEHMGEGNVLDLLGAPQETFETPYIDRTLVKRDYGDDSGPYPLLEHYFLELEEHPLDKTGSVAVTKSYVWRDGANVLEVILMRRFLPRYAYTMAHGLVDRGPGAPYWLDSWSVAQSQLISASAYDAATAALAKLQGTWLVVSALNDGKTVINDEPGPRSGRPPKLQCDGHRWCIWQGDKIVRRGFFHVDVTKTPNEVDVMDEAGKFYEPGTRSGIYKLDVDTCKFCLGSAYYQRPTVFGSKPGSGNLVVVVRRAR